MLGNNVPGIKQCKCEVCCSLPLHSLIQACSFGGWGLEDLPFSVFEGREAERVGHFSRRHGLVHVLFVGEHHKDRLLQLFFLHRRSITKWSARKSKTYVPNITILTKMTTYNKILSGAVRSRVQKIYILKWHPENLAVNVFQEDWNPLHSQHNSHCSTPHIHHYTPHHTSPVLTVCP